MPSVGGDTAQAADQVAGEDRFELVDTTDVQSSPRVVGIDEGLSEELTARTKIWRSHVGIIEGVDGAYSGDHLMPDSTAEAQRSYRAHDRLHEALGEVAAGYLVTRLQRRMTVGLASGRGVGFAVMRLADIAQERPSLVRGYESGHIESLFGRSLVGAWATPIARALDADENEFQLSTALNIPQTKILYMRGWLSGAPADFRSRCRSNERPLNLAIVVGVSNSWHQFYTPHDQNVQLGAVAGYIEILKSLQPDLSGLLDSVAGVGSLRFPGG